MRLDSNRSITQRGGGLLIESRLMGTNEIRGRCCSAETEREHLMKSAAELNLARNNGP